jgi:predicted TPR repeat methyltransferase
MHTAKATSQPDILLRRATSLMNDGHTGAARALLAAARRMAPGSPGQIDLSVRLALHDGQFELARAELDPAIERAPDRAGLRRLRAELRRELGDTSGAAADAAEAVVLDRDDPVAKALLGVLLLELHRPDDAVACLREAVATEPTNPAFREAFAAALDTAGDADAALATLTEGIATAPRYVSLRNAAVLHCIHRHEFAIADAIAEAARSAGVVDACLFGLKGHALSSLGRHEEAAGAYTEALKLGPEDPYVRHLVAAAGVLPSTSRAPDDYLRAVFNGYAERFEAHLLSLGYRVPWLLHDAVQAQGIHDGPVLDLGCGTGLLAMALADLDLGPFVGVDVAPGMLAQAAGKQVYAELHGTDVLDFLRADMRTWPLILAGDVLCYFGALDELFTAVQQRLTLAGLFAFSVELLQPDANGVVPGNGDWALGRQGRFAHAEHYLLHAAEAAGLAVRHVTLDILRCEADAPVLGLIVVLDRGSAAH